MMPCRRCLKPSVRSAFTLMEVLIALGLTVLLMYAIYGGIDLIYRYNYAGRGEIGGQQFTRGLFGRFSKDLRNVSFFLPPAPTENDQSENSGSSSSSPSSSSGSSSSGGSSSGSGAAGGESSGDSTTTVTNTLFGEEAPNFLGLKDVNIPAVFGVIGTADLLHLTVNLPSRSRNFFPANDQPTGQEEVSELKLVSYGLVEIDAITMAFMQKDQKVTRPGFGLGRRVRENFSTIKTDEILKSEDLLAAEVTEISFQYFDGFDFFDTWDSVELRALPRAIEVTFGIWSAPPIRLGRTASSGTGTLSHVRHVFSLPIAESAPEVTQ